MNRSALSVGSSTEAADCVRLLIDVTEALNGIFEQENAALKESRIEEMAPLQAEKARLAAVYARTVRTISTDRLGVSGVDGAQLMKLRSLTATFEARAAHQRQLLEAAGDAHENPQNIAG